jgi:hypothetical protein
MSDRRAIDILALVVSTAALVVSLFSWWATSRQASLMAGQVRAYVQVQSAELVQGLSQPSFMTFMTLRLRIKNLGQTGATNVQGDMSYDTGMPGKGDRINDATLRRFGRMGPGFERSVILRSNTMRREPWPTPHFRGQTVYFFGTVWFTDDTTKENRKDDWCYELPLKTEADLSRTELRACEVLGYESKTFPGIQ